MVKDISNIREIQGLKIIEPMVFKDSRGYFFESFSNEVLKNGLNEQTTFLENGLTVEKQLEAFVQDNESMSEAGTLRGLHWQAAPYAQAKLVRVVKGKVWDVAVDIRPGSPTFGAWKGVVLSDENKLQYYLPCGFAHGFLALTDCIFQYKCSALYCKACERGIRYDDDIVNVAWPFELLEDPKKIITSEKDMLHPSLMATEEWKLNEKLRHAIDEKSNCLENA